MTASQELNRAVAEILGIEGVEPHPGPCFEGRLRRRVVSETGQDTEGAWFDKDWAGDLNACAEFERGLSSEVAAGNILSERTLYVAMLREECEPCFATAEQRCRAFLALCKGEKP